MTFKERIKAKGTIILIVICLPTAIIYDFFKKIQRKRARALDG